MENEQARYAQVTRDVAQVSPDGDRLDLYYLIAFSLQ